MLLNEPYDSAMKRSLILLKPFSEIDNKFKIIDILSAVRYKSVDVNAKTTVKGGTYWVGVVIRLLPAIGLSVTGPRVRAIVVIFRRFSFLASTQGIKGLVIHLKACAVLLAQASGGHCIKDAGQLNCRVSRTNKGIPRFILSSDRLRIRQGDLRMEKFYQTVFNLYRILSFLGKPKLNTITDQFSGNSEFVHNNLKPLVPHFIDALFKVSNPFRNREGFVTWVGVSKVTNYGRPAVMEWILSRYAQLSPLWLAKSAAGTHHDGVQVSSHPYLMIRTIRTILSSPVEGSFRYFISLLPVNAPFKWAFLACEKAAYLFKPLYTLGKLGIKEEAAGKVRLFAMAPTWFQLLLQPVHDVIFLILRRVPQDGTFNQLGPLENHTRFKVSQSLDLTAATDRLWIEIQKWLIAELTGSVEFAHNWANLLTGIEYSINSLKYGLNAIVKYAVGQPMGALSSWPSLALTHHFLVQAAAWKSGVVPVGTWFTDYAILGDDIVIFNKPVADEYRRIIKLIGMEIGLHKSILSRDGSMVEFAKRLFHNGFDVSPVPFKEFFASLFGYGNFLDYARKYNLSVVQFARVLGFKYRALSKVGNGFKSMPASMKRLYIASALPGATSDVQPFFQLGAPVKARWPISLESFWRQFSQSEFRALLKAMSLRLTKALNDPNQFPNLKPNLEKDPLLLDFISSKFSVPVVPWDSGNWATGVSDARWSELIPGPAESKEDWCGFYMLNEPGLSQPIEVNTYGWKLRDYLDRLDPRGLKIDLGAGDILVLRQALAALFDAHILPRRTALQQAGVDVSQLIVKNWLLPEDMDQVFLNFVTVSREAALVPQKVVNLEREGLLSRTKDPVALRMWRKWSKLIQGTVHGGKVI
nr:MAG: RNA-dependent RNA polymerase [Rhizoctonia solani mitovirus 105]